MTIDKVQELEEYTAKDLNPSGKLYGKCKYCDRGMEQELIDENGTFTAVSGKPGFLGHAMDDYFWPCPNPPIGAVGLIPLKYFDTGLIYRMKIETSKAEARGREEAVYNAEFWLFDNTKLTNDEIVKFRNDLLTKLGGQNDK